MIPQPIALSMTLCDQVIVEEGTRKVSVIGGFTRLRGNEFPFTAPPFCVFATLTGSEGEGEITLTVTNLETGEEAPLLTRRILFQTDSRKLARSSRFSRFIFPEPGPYVFTLKVDDDWIAYRRILIRETESEL